MNETIISLKIGSLACSLVDLQETDENVTEDFIGKYRCA
jgi:SUMO ligase MMS21 Smc5/6 complex component